MSLGKGLQSLIPPKSVPTPAPVPPKSDAVEKNYDKNKTEHVFYLEIERIKPNPHQPRRIFDQQRLQELADSIKEHGILQPLVVTKTEEGYQLIVGERRFEAAKIIGLSQLPVVIRDSSDQEKLELALVENIQRDNLNPVEKAYAFKKLLDKFNFSQKDVAKKIGKSREAVANTLRLLDLPAEIQRALLENKITEGHARLILSISNIEQQLLLLKEIVKNSLSIRQAQNLIKKIDGGLSGLSRKTKKSPHLRELEDRLSDILGTRVKLTQKGKKGKIIIEFFSQEELDSIIQRLTRLSR